MIEEEEEGGGGLSREGELLRLFLRLKIRKYKLRDFLAGEEYLSQV